MEINIEQITNELSYNDELREDVIQWLNDNGYLDDFKMRNDYNEY